MFLVDTAMDLICLQITVVRGEPSSLTFSETKTGWSFVSRRSNTFITPSTELVYTKLPSNWKRNNCACTCYIWLTFYDIQILWHNVLKIIHPKNLKIHSWTHVHYTKCFPGLSLETVDCALRTKSYEHWTLDLQLVFASNLLWNPMVIMYVFSRYLWILQQSVYKYCQA